VQVGAAEEVDVTLAALAANVHATEVKITPSDGAAGDYFGDSVAISGDYAVVGAHLDDDADTNSGSAYIYTICAPVPDTTPPTRTITSPANGTTVPTSTITVAGTASDESGIASVTVNGILASGTTSWSAEVTLIEGENMITVVATDNAGNNATETRHPHQRRRRDRARNSSRQPPMRPHDARRR
jgi:hypothetical protein